MKNIIYIAPFVTFFVLYAIFCNIPTVFAAPQDLPSGFTATVLIDYNMIAPTGVKVAPDGRIFVFDLFGTIKIFTEGSGFNPVAFGSIPVNASGDRGLLGAVFDTDFANNPYVYIHYVGTDSKVRIGRFNASTNVGTDFTVLYVAPAASGGQHAGGGIVVDLNGFIFFGIGDSGTPTNSQDLTTSHGKIHRIYRDGTVPSNPFVGTAGVASTTYAYGVRNPFRMTLDTVTGAVYVGDVGFNTWEEVNLIEPGKNYGWALQEGPCALTCTYQNPIYWYQHQFGTNNTNDASIVLGPIYRGSLYPASYYGKAFVTDYVQGFFRTITPTIATSSFSTFSTGNGAVIDMDVAPNGKIYFVTISSPKLYRLDYATSSVNLQPTAVATAINTSGTAPLTVSFSSASSSDPESTPLTYLWDFGDGSTSTEANPIKTYASEGQYAARVSVSDEVNTVQSNSITSTVGTAPVILISEPLSSTSYIGGDTIPFTVTAQDVNGQPLASSSISTTIRLHHSDHSHPFAGPFLGNIGQVTAPIDGELSQNVWLRFTFDAVGINGIHTVNTVDVYPRLAQITVTTNPAGLNVILDGSNHVIPPTVQGVIGMNRQISAPGPQFFGGKQYQFDYWSDGGTRDHTFAFPTSTTVYTAFYREVIGSSTPINLVENGSFENNGNLPLNWKFSRWGNNDVSTTLVSDNHTGLWSVKMEATQINSGEGRIYNNPVPVSSGTVYGLQYFRKNTVPFKAVADVTLNDNSHRYIWLGISQPSTTWLEQNWTFTTPVNSKNVVINLYHTASGTVQIDDFSLFDPLNVIFTPDVTLTVATTSLPLGATTTLSWSVNGTSPICTASGGWSGSQPFSGTLVIAPTSTQNYDLTCTNLAGTSTKSISVTVTKPLVLSLIANSSVEEHDEFDNPIGWTPRQWGSTDAIMEHKHGNSYDGSHSLTTVITDHTVGEAGWITKPIAVSPLTSYIFSEYAQSNGPNKVQVEVTLENGSKKYIWLGRLTNTSEWTKFTKTFITPDNAVTLRVLTYLTGVGTFNIDQITLTPKVITVPPTVILNTNVTTILLGESVTLSWSATGDNLTCLASGGWSDVLELGASYIITPSVTTTYTITCSNQYGSDEKSITVQVQTVPSTNDNLITTNTNFGDSTPAGWIKGSWGNNTRVFSTATSGRTDNSSLRITMNDYVNGDAKWFFSPITVASSTSYAYNHWYKSDTTTELVAEYTLADNSKTHTWLGTVPATNDWTKKSFILVTPSDTLKVTVHHVLKTNGTLDTDDYSLIQN